MKRLISIGGCLQGYAPFSHLFDKTIVLPYQENIDFTEDDVVLFEGGADISPTIYNHKVSRLTGASEKLSLRDEHEVRHFKKAVEAGAGIIGICRGAQLACALSGGSLIQHADNHTGNDHTMTTKDGDVIMVSSVHHQMMNPVGTEFELLGHSTDILSKFHIVEGEKDLPVELEPEVIYFPSTKALAIQYHPEFMSKNSDGVKYAIKLAKEKFNV